MFCDKGMIEMFGIAKEELKIAYYRVMNSKYYDNHTVDSALNMFARYLLDCNINLRKKENQSFQIKVRLSLFKTAQIRLETIYLILSTPTRHDKQSKEYAFNEAIKAVEDCESIDLTPKEIEEN